MAVQVIDRVEGLAGGEGQRLGGGDADHEAAFDEPRAYRDGDAVQVVEGERGAFQGVFDRGAEQRDVLTARDLGNDSAELRVEGVLIGRDVREHAAPVADDRRRRVVARGLDSEQEHRAGVRHDRDVTPCRNASLGGRSAETMAQTFGIIGLGTMGRVLARGILATEPGATVIGSEHAHQTAERVAAELSIEVVRDNRQLVERARTLLLLA